MIMDPERRARGFFEIRHDSRMDALWRHLCTALGTALTPEGVWVGLLIRAVRYPSSPSGAARPSLFNSFEAARP